MNGDNKLNVLDIIIQPGGFFFGGGYKRIHTLLGSCVAITLWHPQKRIGGMCHYLLPTRGSNQKAPKGQYADESFEMFLNELRLANTLPKEYEVKLFGGSNMFGVNNYINTPNTISQQNIEIGKKLLRKHAFSQLTSVDVAGDYHRKIYLELWNGDVWVRRGHKVNNG